MTGCAIVVTPRTPWPLDDGGRIVLWQSVWSCAMSWRTTLVTLVAAGMPVPNPPPEFVECGVEWIPVPHRLPPRAAAVIRSWIGPWPYPLARYRSPRLRSVLRRLVAERKPDFVLLNHLHMATVLDALDGTTSVLREHNLEHRWLARYAESLTNPAARAYARDQARRVRSVEARICARCDLVLAIQDAERDELRRLAPGAQVETVPIGIDFERFHVRVPASPPVVLLAGSFGWPPNADGARLFLAEGWERIRRRVPESRLRIVGKDLPEELAAFARVAGAEPVGYVDDMAVEFARASLLVVPLWVGAGARVKIVEALAARLPVVSTRLGAEGLGLTAGTDYIEAGTAAALGDAVADLLGDRRRSEALSERGHLRAVEQFSLSAVARRTNDRIAEAVEKRIAGGAR